MKRCQKDEQIIRKVTCVPYAAWTEGEVGRVNGVSTLQLVMDDGADEYVLAAPAPTILIFARTGLTSPKA